MASVAVIGAGISGLSAAYYLERAGHSVTLFEANDYFGGHAHTVDVTLDGVTSGVDTGFLVCNDRTYPHLLSFFDELEIDLAASDMSFAVRSERDDLEWSGTSIASLFAQKRNLVRPRFLKFLADIVRFNRATTAMIQSNRVPAMSLADYLAHENYSQELFDWYLWPMVGSIWSSPRGEVMAFDLSMLLRFCHNHGLLQIANRPQWMTVRGGSRTYVQKVISKLRDARCNTAVTKVVSTRAFVDVHFEAKTPSKGATHERFDYAVLATHSDQSKRLLAPQAMDLHRALDAIVYQPNRCVLHTDASLMPKRRAAWASWNYLQTDAVDDRRPVALTYWLNRLQPLPFTTPLFETLNPPVEPAREHVIAEFEYWHPLLNQNAITAQHTIRALQGRDRTYFAGAWLYNGFHEDGIRSALDVVSAINEAASDTPLAVAAE